jgi:hypothetical protein
MLSNFTKRIFLFRLSALLLLVLFGIQNSFGQLTPISLSQRIENATTILEGKVIGQACYWDEAKNHIYTSNLIEVYKIFKGRLSATRVEIITRGGIVGNQMERISNTLELKLGDLGVFTTIGNTAKIKTAVNLAKLKVYAGQQGFIKYDILSRTAKDGFNSYHDIDKEIYAQIAAQTKSDIKIIQKLPVK